MKRWKEPAPEADEAVTTIPRCMFDPQSAVEAANLYADIRSVIETAEPSTITSSSNQMREYVDANSEALIRSAR
jgi:hypothetical protein